jgi:hypothetical protein
MENLNSHDYNCKNVELPLICDRVLSNLNRDSEDFRQYSPKFNEEYRVEFAARIDSARDVLEPKSETLEKKIITERLYKNVEALANPVNWLGGYVEMAQKITHVSKEDFGLKKLKKSINAKDVEGVIDSLPLVCDNIVKYRTHLEAQGLTNEVAEAIFSASRLLHDDKKLQFELLSRRKLIVQSNNIQFNNLFEMLNEILTIGKILYKNTNPVKAQEYTFRYLKKQLSGPRSSSSAANDKTTDANKE